MLNSSLIYNKTAVEWLARCGPPARDLIGHPSAAKVNLNSKKDLVLLCKY